MGEYSSMEFCEVCEGVLSLQIGEVKEDDDGDGDSKRVLQNHCAMCGFNAVPSNNVSLGCSDASTNWKSASLRLLRFDPSMPRALVDMPCECSGTNGNEKVCIVCDPILMKSVMRTQEKDMNEGIKYVCVACGQIK